MTGGLVRQVWRAVLLFGVPNALFSAAMVQHSTSLAVGLVYLACAPPLVLVAMRLVPRVDERRAGWLLVGVFVVAAVAFAVVYPIADARKVGGGGTDADDALDLAARALLRGQYPYLERTYLNNPITPLLGWVGLAVPFVTLLGRAAYLNVFWLGVWLLLLVRLTRSAWLALLLAVLTFVVFPGVGITYLNGSDSFASVVAICLLVVLMDRVPWPLLAVLTGVVLSSRFNVVLLLPVLVAIVGGRRAIPFGAVAAGVWLGVSFAPWLVDSADFTPLHTYGMLGRFDSVVPHFGLIVPVLTGVLALWLAWRVLREGFDAWLAMALVLSAPVVVDFVAELAFTRQLDLWPLVYGLMATPVWVFASVPAVRSALSAREAEAQPPFWRLAARSASASRS
jgi:hypothetical protein